MSRWTLSVRERFEQKYVPEPNSGCWLWTASVTRLDYGQFWDGRKHTGAHRAAYELYRGPIPDGMELDHLCRVSCCVNPWHLEAVTHLENVRRGESGWNLRGTHCPNGHSYDETNTAHEARGPNRSVNRRCRRCHAANSRRQYARRQARDAS